LAEGGDPRVRRVMGRALVEGPLRRLADVRRRVEIGLADLEMDDVAALRLEGPRPGGNLECGLGADHAHALGDPHVELLVSWSRSLARRLDRPAPGADAA